MPERHLREQIVHIGRLLEEKSLIESTAGNISCRLDDEQALITPAGCRKGRLSPESLVRVRISDGHSQGNPSSETPMHMGLYREFPKIGAVIHAHPPYATAFAVAGVELQYDVLPEVVAQLGRVPIAAYGRPTTEAMFASIRGLVDDRNAILLKNHGSVTFGADLEEAFNYLEQLEFYASVVYRARQLGKVDALPDEEFNWLLSVRQAGGNGE
ncbi:MAG TPA: class II aldolase/adducin family protein [Acidobacteriota bacterium]|nr:class II aldolase/adducin family protein [Acidobacteriota bacterium]